MYSIVTCGGLCPGLNAVVRELVIMLGMYGVKEISGIRAGFKGGIPPLIGWSSVMCRPSTASGEASWQHPGGPTETTGPSS